MGLFLDLAGFLTPQDRVQAAVTAAGRDADVDFYSVNQDRTLMLFGKPTGNFSFTQSLSRDLGVPAFGFHIHDDDLWLYEFYVAGELIDQFNTLPGYWKELSAEEESRWRGNADLISGHWPGVDPETIRRYLVHRDFDNETPSKAYPDDKFEAWDCWQLADFLRKLGIPYPSEAD